jgi:hypothetical protein
MLTFNEFLAEVIDEPGKRSKAEENKIAYMSYFNFPYRFRDIKFAPSIHASAQAYDRRGEFRKSDWVELHKKTAKKIQSNKLTSGWFLFYSESMKQGYIGVLKKNKFTIVTVLPKGKNNPLGGKSGSGTTLELMEILNKYSDSIIIESISDINIINLN